MPTTRISLVMTLLAADLALASSLAAYSSSPQLDDWPVARYDAANTGFSKTDISPPFLMTWRVRAPRGTFLLSSGGAICIGAEGNATNAQPAIIDSSGKPVREWKGSW